MGYKDNALYQDLTPTLAYVALFSSLGSFSFGYDNNWWGGVIGSAYFGEQFGSGTRVNAQGRTVRYLLASDTSTGTALGTAGIMMGCMVAPIINERYGRKKSFIIMGIVGIIGTLIQTMCTVKHQYWVMVGGKVVVNISVGIAAGITSVYQAECSPKRIRGALINCYVVVQNFGTFLANAVMFGVFDKRDSRVWLVPSGIQFVFPVIIALGSGFLPESPRWLVSQGRLDEARAVVRRLRGNKLTESEVADEVEEIRAAFEHERSIQAGTSWLQIFRGTDLRRTLVSIGVQAFQQGQGISFMNNYLNVTLLALGYTNTYSLLVVLYACKVIISVLGFYLPDRIGRRPLVLGGGLAMMGSMFAVGAASAVTNNQPRGAYGRLTLAGVYIWVLTYSFTWAPMTWTIPSEIPSNALRGPTLGMVSWSGFGVGLLSNLLVPYIQNPGYGNLRGQIAFLFGGISFAALIFCYFFVPELNGRSLEDTDILFENHISARKFATTDISKLKRAHAKAEDTPSMESKVGEEARTEKV